MFTHDRFSQTGMKSLLGQLLNGRYSIARQLQQTSSHITYLAEDKEKLGYGQCLVKQFTLDISHNTSNWHEGDRFKRFLIAQIKRVNQFNEHPQIPPVLDYFLWGKELCLIRKFIVGKTLAEEIAERPLEELEVVYLLRETLAVLDVIHQAGEMHLNLKPTNIIFATISQKIFITDFDRLEYLLENKIVKSPIRKATSSYDDYYIAPEQKAGKPQFSSDFYGLGVIAIKALTGKYPHEIRFDSMDNYARASLVDIGTGEETQISSQLARVLHNLVNENPQLRYSSTEAILQALTQPKNVVVLPSLDTIYSPSERKKQLAKTDKANRKLASQKFPIGIKWFVIAILVAVAAIAFSRISDRSQFAEYRNENYGISFKYPQDWTVEELEDPITGEIAVIVSPLENASDSFQEKIYLSIDNYAADREEYGRYLLDKIRDTANVMNLTYKQDSKLLGDRSTQSIIYQRKQDNIDLQQKETFTFKNGKVYSLTYVAEKNQYQKFLDTVNKVIKSFSIDS